jgi:SET domain-containing protein
MIKTNSKYKSKKIFSWINDKVVVKDTKKYGVGAFAKEKILKNEKIAMFGGHVITREEENKLPAEIYDNAIQIDDNLVIGSILKEEIDDGAMFNHSCNANAGIKGQILLVAMRDILKSEQITFDFGTVLFNDGSFKKYKLKCLCGAKNCRKIITDNDWMKQEIQNKYRGYFPIHIQEKIDNQNAIL